MIGQCDAMMMLLLYIADVYLMLRNVCRASELLLSLTTSLSLKRKTQLMLLRNWNA